MNAGEDEPSKSAGPDGSHVGVKEVIEELSVVVHLVHRVVGEDAECHQSEGERPKDGSVHLKIRDVFKLKKIIL